MSPLNLFRRLAIAEAITWALLLVGMFLKYVTETTELGVRVFGMVHGVVFIAYCLGAVFVAVNQRWSVGTALLALASAVPPFMTVWFDRRAERRGQLFDLPPLLAIGMMLLAASPGGTSANLFSHLFRGDVALNVTLTAINSIIAIVSLPLITNLAIAHYDQSDTVSLQFGKVVEVFAIVLIPVAVGMLVRAKAPAFAARTDKGVRIASAVILAVLVIGILLDQRENVGEYLADVGLVAALFCAASLVAGYVIPKALGIVEGQAIASSMEIGVHNATLAIFVAVEVLEATEISIPAAVYSLFMFVFAALWGSFISRRVGRAVPAG